MAIPKVLAERIRLIYGRLGYKSISDFVASCVMQFLPREENRYEEIMEAIKHGVLKEGGDEGEL